MLLSVMMIGASFFIEAVYKIRFSVSSGGWIIKFVGLHITYFFWPSLREAAKKKVLILIAEPLRPYPPLGLNGHRNFFF